MVIKLLNNVNIKSLAQIAVYGAVGLSTAGILLYTRTREKIRNSDFYQDALTILKSNEAAKVLLGEPIKDGNFKLDSRINTITENDLKFQTPVYGPKEKGTLYFWAHKFSPTEKWNIYRMELELKKDNSKRLLIKHENE